MEVGAEVNEAASLRLVSCHAVGFETARRCSAVIPANLGRAQTVVSAIKKPATCNKALQRAQTCCRIRSNGNGFLHEEGPCCWAMHASRKGKNRIPACRRPPSARPGW